MRKLKIGFVLDDGLDSLDGVQQYILNLGKWLASRGHEVHYLVGETSGTHIKNVHPLSKNLRVRFNANRLSTPLPASKKKINELLKKHDFNILHVQVPYSPFMAARVISAAPKKTAVVGTFHILPYGRLQKTGVYLLGLWLKRTSRRFSLVFAVSPPAQQLCKKAFGLKASILPNTIDIARMKAAPPVKNELLRIVFLGRLVERKGCLQLVQAIKILTEKRRNDAEIPKFKLLIGGKGPAEGKVKGLIRKYQLEDIVKMAGFIDEKHKPSFLAEADIAVFPSLGGESFGIVLIEAMAAGAGVVVGGNNPGYSSVLGDTPECLVDAGNPSMLAVKLEELLADSDLRQSLHAIQQESVKQFDINIVGTRLEQAYLKACQIN